MWNMKNCLVFRLSFIAMTSLKRFRFATLCNPIVHAFKKHCNSYPINTSVSDWLCRNMYFKTKGYQTIFSLRRKSRSLKLFSRASPFERSLSQKRLTSAFMAGSVVSPGREREQHDISSSLGLKWIRKLLLYKRLERFILIMSTWLLQLRFTMLH